MKLVFSPLLVLKRSDTNREIYKLEIILHFVFYAFISMFEFSL